MTCLRRARLVADSMAAVLVLGESGTGKELLARGDSCRQQSRRQAIHGHQLCRHPGAIAESELFGYAKGAFTGAATAQQGLFQAADGGTLFLDEIGDMPLSLQAKLLRGAAGRACAPGGCRPSRSTSDVRIISATHRNLDQMRADRTFREDCSTAQRGGAQTAVAGRAAGGHPLLVNHFLKRSPRATARPVPTLAPDALAALVAAPWPGNVRQLENLLEQAVALSTTHVIPLSLIRHSLDDSAAPLVFRSGTRKTFERDYLVRILKLTAGNAAQAAQMAGRNRTEFYKLLQRHNLEPGMFSPEPSPLRLSAAHEDSVQGTARICAPEFASLRDDRLRRSRSACLHRYRD